MGKYNYSKKDANCFVETLEELNIILDNRIAELEKNIKELEENNKDKLSVKESVIICDALTLYKINHAKEFGLDAIDMLNRVDEIKSKIRKQVVK